MSRRVLVTGAASGLGLALVRRFADAGDQVLATDLAGTVDVLPEGVHYQRLDVRSDDDWSEARDWVSKEWGGLDVLVNNAGVATGGRIDVSAMDEWELATQVNLLGVARGCHTFAGLFKEQRSGHIVNVASIAGLVHPPAMAAYNAVKAGVVALSETLGHELAPYGIASSVVCPSFFRTNLVASMRGRDEDAAAKIARLVNESPLSADDIAVAVLEGIDRKDPLILPDEVARAAYELKWSDRTAYDKQMAVTAMRAFERAEFSPELSGRSDARAHAHPDKSEGEGV